MRHPPAQRTVGSSQDGPGATSTLPVTQGTPGRGTFQVCADYSRLEGSVTPRRWPQDGRVRPAGGQMLRESQSPTFLQLRAGTLGKALQTQGLQPVPQQSFPNPLCAKGWTPEIQEWLRPGPALKKP